MSDQSPEFNVRELAKAAYRDSRLSKDDYVKWTARKQAIALLLGELGLELQSELEEPKYELQGVTITAHTDRFASRIMSGMSMTPSRVRSLEDEINEEVQYVIIRASEKCSICNEMRHSDDIKVGQYEEGAAALGRFFIEPHDCKPKEKDRGVGLRLTAKPPQT